MSELIIQPAAAHDIPGMALLWHEKLTIQQQTDRRYQLAPGGEAAWSRAAAAWLQDSQYRILVAKREYEVVGYLIGCVQAGPPGLLPAQVGVVTDMAVGAHSYQSGLGRQMLDPLRAWFHEQGLTHFIVYAPHRQPVEQAFWRAMGATVMTDILWMKL